MRGGSGRGDGVSRKVCDAPARQIIFFLQDEFVDALRPISQLRIAFLLPAIDISHVVTN